MVSPPPTSGCSAQAEEAVELKKAREEASGLRAELAGLRAAAAVRPPSPSSPSRLRAKVAAASALVQPAAWHDLRSEAAR